MPLVRSAVQWTVQYIWQRLVLLAAGEMFVPCPICLRISYHRLILPSRCHDDRVAGLRCYLRALDDLSLIRTALVLAAGD